MRDVAMTQSEAFAAVAAHKKAMSRHSPEGFDEVLGASLREDEHGHPAPPTVWSDADFARHAASILIAFADNKPLEFRSASTGWRWREYGRAVAPNVQTLGVEWRVKRTPRKVYVAFHESGSVADVWATPPVVDMPGRLASDYIEFEEKLD